MTNLRMQDQIVCGERVIVVIVRETGVAVAGGAFAGVDPVALLVGECGKWCFVSIEEGFGQEEISLVYAERSRG